jgi:hypothetical protein
MEVDDVACPSTQIRGRNQRKTPQITKSKIEAKIPPKIMKMKNGAAHWETRFNPKHNYIEVNQMLTWCGNHPNILSLFGRLERSLTSLLSSLRHEAHPHLSKMRL